MKRRARLVAKAKSSILLVEEKDDGFFYLFEFRDDGFVGDTWHQTIEDAKAQANHYFGNSISAWQEVPLEIADAVAFGRQFQSDPLPRSLREGGGLTLGKSWVGRAEPPRETLLSPESGRRGIRSQSRPPVSGDGWKGEGQRATLPRSLGSKRLDIAPIQFS